MGIDLTRLDRRVRWGLLLSALVMGGLDYWAGGENAWFKSLFVIAIAGMVGYFTNFLAIKMLFQPKQGQVLGWRGLVPKNKAHIARSLGQSVQEQLLSPDIILAYIRERALIEHATHSLAQWLDAALQKPDVRHAITTRLVTLVDARGAAWITSGFDVSEQALKQAASNPEIMARYWQPLRTMLVEFTASDANRALAAEKIQRLIYENLPQIADWLDAALEDYLRRRKAVGSMGLGLKNMVSLDQAAIRQLLQRFVADPQVAEQFVTGLDAAFDMLQKQLENDSTQDLVQAHLAQWIEHLADLARRHLLPTSIDSLRAYLNDSGNWASIEEQLMAVLEWGKTRALELLHTDAGQRTLRGLIERAVQRLNVTELVEEQVMKLDTDELEKMVLDNTGGNLTVIQILGGGLGVIAGTVQVHLVFALPIALLVGMVYVAWWWNERAARKSAVGP